MDLMVAVDNQFGIGCDGKLQVICKPDMEWFRSNTVGRILLYGRKTLLSFPNQKPLPNRKNIIMSKKVNFSVQNASVCNSWRDLYRRLLPDQFSEIMVIGGASIYRQLLPFCNRAFITKFNKSFVADSYFPNIDEHENWYIEWQKDWAYDAVSDISYQFCCYKQKKVLPLESLCYLDEV